jgi:polar amino acid transport system substrate-binding protein
MRTERRRSALRVALAACAMCATAAVADDRPFRTKQAGVLRVAVYHDYPPFADQGQGIEVEIGTALAGKLGLVAEVRSYPDADSIDGDLRNIIWRGHPLWREQLADVMLHVPVDPHVVRKNDQVRIFGAYFRERLVVARNRARIPQLPTMQIFATEKIGVEVETMEDRYLVGSFGGTLRENVVHFPSLIAASAALVSGEVSAVMGRQTLIEAGLGAARSSFEIGTAPTPGIATSGWELGMAVKEDNPELAAALEKAIAALLREGFVERAFTSRGLSYRAPVGVGATTP